LLFVGSENLDALTSARDTDVPLLRTRGRAHAASAKRT
jgi:hypothetical protein